MLAEAQARLEDRFATLARERKLLGDPVYVLEHELEQIHVDAIRQALARGSQLDEAHWLLWVVVATEIGYAYDGEEFWRSFEEAVQGWRHFGNRNTIRTWFHEFSRRYSGFKPVGRWAAHFSIIAWPITHSILPRDLQGLFAKRIYDLRYQLASPKEVTAENLGALLYKGETGGTSRFQHFLGQTELAGRLVLALRDEDGGTAAAAICPQTLGRIVADLERRRSAGDWLRDARRVLRDARHHGIVSHGHQGTTIPKRATTESEFALGVRLVARQTTEETWLLGVKLPDFSQMLERAGLPHSLLDKTRVRFTGKGAGLMPGRALLSLSGSERRIPSVKSDELAIPLLALERDVEGLSGLLASTLRVKGASPWLLRVQEDGVARQSLGNFVRTGQSYLIVSDGPLSPDCIQQLNLTLVGAAACDATVYTLRVPAFLNVAELRALESIRIGYSLRVNVEPVGLIPRWDGSTDYSTWLTTEELILRLHADHPVREFLVRVDHAAPVRIEAGNQPDVLVSFGTMAAGSYIIEVSAVASASGGSALEPSRFAVLVRAPAPWAEGVKQRAGFRAIVEPASASLQSVLSGTARARIFGPLERAVSIDAKLFNLNGHMTEEIPLGTVAALGDEAAIERTIGKLSKEPYEERVHAAPRLDIRFSVGELGQSVLSFAQEVSPLRWRLSRDNGASCVRLIDEAGSEHSVAIRSYRIAEPDRTMTLTSEICDVGLNIDPPGALFIASLNKKMFSAIVSVPPSHKLTLNDLRAEILVSPSNRLPKDIPRLLSRLRLWVGAKQVLGPLGNLRKNEVRAALEQRIAQILCGQRWADLTTHNHPPAKSAIDRLRHEVGGSVGFGARLRDANWIGAPNEPGVREEFARLASVYRICNDASLCALALQVAFAPTAIKPPWSDDGAPIWDQLAKAPTLSRGAFFARIVASINGGAVV